MVNLKFFVFFFWLCSQSLFPSWLYCCGCAIEGRGLGSRVEKKSLLAVSLPLHGALRCALAPRCLLTRGAAGCPSWCPGVVSPTKSHARGCLSCLGTSGLLVQTGWRSPSVLSAFSFWVWGPCPTQILAVGFPPPRLAPELRLKPSARPGDEVESLLHTPKLIFAWIRQKTGSHPLFGSDSSVAQREEEEVVPLLRRITHVARLQKTPAASLGL